jgi:hypothetical protein
MAKKKKTTKKARGAKSSASATGSRRGVSQRVAAMAQHPLTLCEGDDNLQTALNLLRNKEEPIAARLAALQALQAASFSVIAFAPCRGEYIATLHEIVDDPDPELRQRVLGVLAREKDGFAQKKLLEGLQNADKALVSPEKALQLLSYDVHSDAYPLAREIVNNPPNTAAKREALRLLAADATAAPLLEKVLRDKSEPVAIRQVSAAALHSLDPEKLQTYAREILLDKSEQKEIQATSLTALTQFGNAATIANDKALMKRVQGLSGQAGPSVKQSARRFLSKYGK